MDLSNVVVLAAAVVLAVELVKQLVESVTHEPCPSVVKIVAAIVAGQILAPVVAHSVWGDTEIVDGHALSSMDGGSQFLVGLFVSGVAVGAFLGLKALSKVGSSDSLT